jgi:hypothetical protein
MAKPRQRPATNVNIPGFETTTPLRPPPGHDGWLIDDLGSAVHRGRSSVGCFVDKSVRGDGHSHMGTTEAEAVRFGCEWCDRRGLVTVQVAGPKAKFVAREEERVSGGGGDGGRRRH